MQQLHLRRVIHIAAITTLTSCTPIPTPGKLDDADLGTAPQRSHAVQAATKALRANLPDFDSAKIVFGEVERGFYSDGRGSSAQRFAWMMTAWVDAKNDHGAFVGTRPYHFFLLNNRLVATASPQAVWTGRGYQHSYKVEEMHGGGLTHVQAGLRQPSAPPSL